MVSPGRWHYNGEGDCAAVTCFIIGFDHRPGGLEALDVQIMITSSSCMMDGMAKSSHRISWRFASCEFPLAYASVHDNVSNNPTFGIHTCAHKNFSLSLSAQISSPQSCSKAIISIILFCFVVAFFHITNSYNCCIRSSACFSSPSDWKAALTEMCGAWCCVSGEAESRFWWRATCGEGRLWHFTAAKWPGPYNMSVALDTFYAFPRPLLKLLEYV